MRDAFGGTFLMYLILIMVVVFITFMTETLKFVQAYRVKNAIINYIEQYEGFNENVHKILEDPDAGYLEYAGYDSSIPKDYESYPTTFNSKNDKYCSDKYGYCIKREYCKEGIGYYKVITNVTLHFTEVLEITPITVPVTGQTRYVTLSNVEC